MDKSILFALAFVLIFFPHGVTIIRSDPSTTTIFVYPQARAVAVGLNFTIDVNIADVVGLYGWEFKLRWNSTLLNATNVTEGSFLAGGGSTFFVYEVNNTGGYLLVGCTLMGLLFGVDGNGTLATIQFRVKEKGECVLDLYDTKLLNPQTPPQPIPHQSVDGFFTNNWHGPTANFTYSSSYPYRTVLFNASSSVPGWNGTHDAPIVDYQWDFGDGNTTEVSSPVINHTYASNEAYNVTLNVTDSRGLWNVTSKTPTLSPDIAISSPPVPTAEVYIAWVMPFQISVVVENEGVTFETFNVTIRWENETQIVYVKRKEVTNLAGGTQTTLTFSWNLADISVDTYTVSCNASAIINETDTGDNAINFGTVKVKFPGDANGDGFIGGYDATVVSINWWSSVPLGHEADFNGDGFVGGYDATVVSVNWWTNVPKP